MEQSDSMESRPAGKGKFIVGGLLIIVAVIYLIYSSTQASAQYFLTVDEVYSKGDSVLGRDLRVSGAVIGDTIQYDSQDLRLTFSIAHIPGDNKEIEELGGLATVLNKAVNDPNSRLMEVVYIGPKPDLLQHEAQAIMTGQVGEDGVFYADELLLKCPTKYEEAVPEQSEG